jgi:hypothetical protein
MHYRLIWTNVSITYNALNLKSLSKRLLESELNHGDFKVSYIAGYSSQHMQRAVNKLDRLVVYKNKNMTKNALSQRSVVRLLIKGSFSLAKEKYQGEFQAHVYPPKKKGNQNKSNVTLRISLTNNDHKVKTDSDHEKLVSSTIAYVDRVLGTKHVNDWELSSNFIGEASLISPENGSVLAPNTLRHLQAKKVFVGLNKELENDKINGVHYRYDDVSNNRVGKKLAGAYFKPHRNRALNVSKRMPTVNVFNTLNVQISGRVGLNRAKDILKKFSKAFKKVNDKIKIPKTNLVPVVIRKREKVVKCRKNNPPADIDGSCPDGLLPKVRGDNVCCYKERLRRGTAGKYIQQFRDAKKPLPSAYDKFKNMNNVEYKLNLVKNENKKIFYIKQPYQKSGKTYYKQWKCKYSTKPEINHVGKDLLHLNMSRGKKGQKCDRIKEELERRSRNLHEA